MGIFKDGRINLHSGEFSGLSIIAIVIALRLLGFLQTLELDVLDWALRRRPAEPTDDKVTIVTITEADIQESLNYPITDRSLAELLNQLQTYEPRVIGLDVFRDFPVGDGYEELANVFATSDNIIGIKKISEPAIAGPSDLPPERVGFVDAPLDPDGSLRRSLLGVHDKQGDYQFSFTIRIAESYLADEGLILENGRRDTSTMRFGDAEVPRFRTNTGGYVREDDAGNQTLINFRAGITPFSKVTYSALMSDSVDPALLKDRVVLVGYDAESAKDLITVAAIPKENPGLVPGVDVQAHAVSQLINAALNRRAFLRTLSPTAELLIIVFAGLSGIGLARLRFHPYLHFLIVFCVSVILSILFYALVLVNFWISVVPIIIVFAINASSLYSIYQLQAKLVPQLKQREQLVDWTFSTIHNGPLQTLARLLKEWPNDSPTPDFDKDDLRQLNQELRDLYDAMRQEMLMPQQQLVLSQQQIIDLNMSLSELLYEIYSNTIKRRKDFFGKLLHITDFKALDDSQLTPEHKRELGRFLEEALLNVCKYAPDTTRLKVICQPEGGDNIIRIVDNGTSGLADAEREGGYGTRQAKQLAQKLRGSFTRQAVEPKGVQCELRWPIALNQQQRFPWINKLKFQKIKLGAFAPAQDSIAIHSNKPKQ